nr:MAG TPA: hypothetical protein [Caudoviricetes sp.]DAM43372.1 MAG TPA: hypothetical protein [Caudoviricetes sp.]DAU04247.1 MAG TPA: hypothetical protein [Caudoviricetes sp.]
MIIFLHKKRRQNRHDSDSLPSKNTTKKERIKRPYIRSCYL